MKENNIENSTRKILEKKGRQTDRSRDMIIET